MTARETREDEIYPDIGEYGITYRLLDLGLGVGVQFVEVREDIVAGLLDGGTLFSG